MEPPAKPPASSSSPSASFPKLEVLDPTKPHTFTKPAKRINEGPDVARFLVSKAYRDIGLFVLQLNRALCPRKKPAGEGSGTAAAQTFTLATKREDPPAVARLRALLDKVAALVDEAPPDPGPRRFGNVSFRKWYALLQERADGLLREYVAPEVLGFAASKGGADGNGDEGDGGDSAMVELKSYFLGAFGSAQRLDYGTGHELSFLAFLGCLWKLGAFGHGEQGEDTERSIVLGVFEPYLKVIRKLILTYTLEPAGSHGVWGLDDHSFMPYIFGSAQLTRPISENEAMPQEGSVLRAPKPGDVLKASTVEVQRELNMYFSAIGFIHDVKKGPFWEHSPILFDVSGIKDGWGKINKGMIKMFNAEVLSKFPVVQHFHFGSLFSWDQDPDAAAPAQSVHMANQPTVAAAATPPVAATMPPPAPGPGTAAPWAQAVRMPGPAGPGIPYSRVPAPAPPGPAGDVSMGGARTPRPPPPMGPRAGDPGAVTRAPWAKGP